jgi:hypothetical protein
MNQVNAVLLTYRRRATTGWIPVLLAIVALFVVGQMAFGSKIPASFIWMSFYFTAPIAIHVKQQAVQVRERILPAAMGVHLTVGLVLIFLAGVLMAMYGMFAEWHWCWGYPGLCVAIAGATFAGFATQARWLLPLFFIAPIGGQFPAVRNWIEALWRGEMESSGVLLQMMGIGAFAFAIYYLLTATEENYGYYFRLNTKNTDLWQRTPVETEQSQALKEYWRGRHWFALPEPRARAMLHWREWARGTLWQQLRLWEFGRGLGNTLRSAFVFPLMLLIMPLVMGGKVPVVSLLKSPLLLFPAYIVVQLRMQQKSAWTAEFLRPVSRQRFYVLAGLGMFLTTVAVWAMMVVIALCGAEIFWPGSLTVDLIMQFMLLTGIGQLWVFAIGVWMMRYRSQVLLGMAFMLPMFVIMFSMITRNPQAGIDVDTLLIALAVSCLLCGSILLDAYRRWLRVEIG